MKNLQSKHYHTYERAANKNIYRCIHPECTHYTQREFIKGKSITCAKCGEITIALDFQLRAAQNRVGAKKLTCLKCSESPKKFALTEAENVALDLIDLLETQKKEIKEEEPNAIREGL